MTASYLRYKKGVYYVRVRVPQDLKHLIPRNEIIKSLRTSEKRIATLLAKDYIYQINRKVVLLRTGYLDLQKVYIHMLSDYSLLYTSHCKM